MLKMYNRVGSYIFYMQVADEHLRGILSDAAKSMEDSPDLLAALRKGKSVLSFDLVMVAFLKGAWMP